MQHLRTSLLSLLIGTSLMAASCGKINNHWTVIGETRVYNRLTFPIELTLVNYIEGSYKQIEMRPGDSFIVVGEGMSINKVVDPRFYTPGLFADTAKIKFNDSLCYAEHQRTGPILHNIDSYTYQRRGDRDYLFFFDIDSTLLNLATKCD